jgi:hypothetical protein
VPTDHAAQRTHDRLLARAVRPRSSPGGAQVNDPGRVTERDAPPVPPASAPAHRVAQPERPVAEPALLQQLQVERHVLGQNRRPPPTDTGARYGCTSSTIPARSACAASVGPSTVTSWSSADTQARTASGSNDRSTVVRAVVGSPSVVE